MCGISAIISKSETVICDITPMLNAIKHRGDAEPISQKLGKADLGSVRLRIVDRQSGEQPFYNEDKSIGLVFNGEIYNYKTLKEQLQDQGHTFKSDCDTEVLVHLYEQHGIEMMKLLDGMFAFILYDNRTNVFFAGRDNFGIKPLYYCENETAIFFSSELKSFLDLAVNEFKEVPPATYLSNDGLTRYRNFTVYPIIKDEFQFATGKIRTIIEDAVKKRVQTDLPIGVFLSGGLDSSIVYLLAKKYHHDVTAIIIGDDNAEDVIFAKRLCNENGFNYKHIQISKEEILNSIPGVIFSIETFEPNPVRGSALSFQLSKAANELGLKVILCGEGSDEIFGGYGDFVFAKTEQVFQNITQNLLDDLYRTQLLRIDKTGMAFNVEVREPFMDIALVDYAIKISPQYKIGKIEGKVTTKYILREAFKQLLPSYIYNRDKMTLMEGAGADSVEVGKGMFYNYAQKMISDTQFEELKEAGIFYNISTKEEAYYYSIYKRFFAKALFNNKRTYNAKVEIKKSI